MSSTLIHKSRYQSANCFSLGGWGVVVGCSKCLVALMAELSHPISTFTFQISCALHAKPKLCLTESENLPVNPDLLGVPVCVFVQSTKSSHTHTKKQKGVCFSMVKLCGSIMKSILNSVFFLIDWNSHHRITPQRKGSSVPTSASFVYEQGSCREGDVTHPQILSRLRAEPEPEPGDQCST